MNKIYISAYNSLINMTQLELVMIVNQSYAIQDRTGISAAESDV